MKRVGLLAFLAVSVSLVVGCMAAPEPTDGGEDPSEQGENASIDPEAVGTATQLFSTGEDVNVGNLVICAGGYAPVRYYNPSSCGGTIQDYYPQGMHGWAQTGGGCAITGGVDYYFHPNNGQHGGWIEEWRLCNY